MRLLGIPFSSTACDYFRVAKPLQTIGERGLAHVEFVPEIQVPGGEPIRRVRVGEVSPEQRLEIIESFGYGRLREAEEFIKNYYYHGPDAATFDVAVFTRRFETEAVKLINTLKARGVTVVYDIDDDAFSVPRMNPAYAAWGTDGAQVLKWYEWLNKPIPFQPHTPQAARAHNKKMLDGLIECCRAADAITVTTEPLRQVYSKFNKNTFVIPNQMAFRDWAYVRPLEHEGEQWFGWAGSRTHFEDLVPLQDAVLEVLRLVPNSYFIVLGFPEILDHMPKVPRDRCRVFDFMDIFAYRNILAGIEVVWAPSAPNRFNAGKSDIRVLEAWMCPAPVVASETTYGPTVRECGGGFVAKSPKDWVRHTVRLLTDSELHAEMAGKGATYTLNNRTYETQAHLWLEVYEKVRGQTLKRAA